ncbi:MAG: bifunctional folylpolyglutamate synthase/dihydrofolate synthase [Mediterranea sp.]|jgi:dihydrofolate synthase/folylpolyglutamate synthase|nr:bifunctional folylpolyglutamate synthase/dihydrofolate synthase [Mediterranea sp.]
MNYQETLTYLYESVPMFQQIGGAAYKEGLENSLILNAHSGHPNQHYHTIHIAGTNGKGSCSHTLAAILQAAGYKVGLYTSPHLVDFRERIRVNGVPVSEEYVVEYVARERSFFEPLRPSFFELTTDMAFRYFAYQKVDIAVIEVGMGGRLDCTNLIHPLLSIITNISLDHTQYLGDTLAKIAVEKAGIIKERVPVVIGETTPETKEVFRLTAEAKQAPIVYAEAYNDNPYPELEVELQGLYQEKNTRTLLAALSVLKSPVIETKLIIPEVAVRDGFAHVCELTGLMGRWQRLQEHPTLVCDTGHNIGGITYIVEQLRRQTYRRLHVVIGMVNDKDIRGVLALLPHEADYYFTRASVKRAMSETELAGLAAEAGLQGNCYPAVPAAVRAALQKSLPEDFIFVGGSSFVVADLLAHRDALNLH